ncbi:MAG: DUF1737 domain-containing protein [Micromonosporaceae bacterium]|nr:DUF1737 domain-containing protein [Micromonosporaceae bacterium]
MTHLHERLRYRLLTGEDNAEFCARVSRLLEEGYELYGSPAIAHDGQRAVVAQALILPPYEAVRFRGAVASAPPENRPVDTGPVDAS